MLLTTSLPHRSIIRISGADRLAFLQGLVSNNVSKASATRAVYAALLTPQGKFLHDLFILEHEDAYLVDCESARAEDLINRLSAYKLRSKVTFENLADAYDVWAVWDGPKVEKQIDPHLRRDDSVFGDSALVYPDPRLPDLGMRAFIPKGESPETKPVNPAAYDSHRLLLGIADGSRDLEIEKSTLAEGNFDLLNGVDWKKGCYVGQELTARMHYRGLAKKRLYPVRIEGAVYSGAPLSFGETEAGTMRSQASGHGLALLNIEATQQSIEQNQPFTFENAKIYPFTPFWMPQKG